MNIKAFISENWDLSIVLVIYSVLAFILLNFFQYNLMGDEISYISIAHHYATGNWNEAINAYWSPLYSWLIAPFLLGLFDPFQSAIIPRAISLIIGFVTIIGLNRLAKTFKLDGMVRSALLVSCIPMVLFFAIRYATPDLLVSCILVFYFAVIFNSRYHDDVSNGFWSGFLGALGYLAKSFVFPFFLVHFILSNLICYFEGKKRKKILKNLFLGLAVFFIVSGLWIGMISSKQGEVTIGTAKDHNHALVGPTYPEHPIYSSGLLEPSNKDAVSIWEDPAEIQLEEWNPLESSEYFVLQMEIVKNNVLRTIAFLERFSPIAMLILILSIYFVVKSESRRVKFDLVKILMTILIYIGGYVLIFVEPRYLWPISFLLLINGFYLVNYLYERGSLNLSLRNIFLIMVMLSFMITPIMEIGGFVGSGDQLLSVGVTLRNEYNLQGNIASNDRWADTMSLSYYLGSRYFGVTKKSNQTSLEQELELNNIDYYFVWGGGDELTFNRYQEITGNKIKNLRIYSQPQN
jgi:hypothetical protein